MHVCTCACVHTKAYVRARVVRVVCVHSCAYTCGRERVHVCARTRVGTCAYTCARICVHVSACVRTHTRIRTHVYSWVHARVYTCVRVARARGRAHKRASANAHACACRALPVLTYEVDLHELDPHPPAHRLRVAQILRHSLPSSQRVSKCIGSRGPGPGHNRRMHRSPHAGPSSSRSPACMRWMLDTSVNPR